MALEIVRPTDSDDARSDSLDSPSTSSPRFRKSSNSPSPAPRGLSKSSNALSIQKLRQIEWIFQLQDVAEGLMTKLYRLKQILELRDDGAQQFPDAYWKSGLFPNAPKLCVHVVKKFPDHPVKLLPEKVDKAGFDLLRENAECHFAALEPWLLVLLDLMTFREQALRVIMEMSSTVVTLLPNQNPLLLHAFMNLFCAFVKVNLYAETIPRKMLLQIYNLTHTILRNGRDYEFYHRLVQFIDSFDPPLKGLHEDLNFVSHRVGEILDAIGSTIFLGSDFERIRSEGFLSPYHPRYPEKLTNSAHPARAQDLSNVYVYREWVLLGYLVCPSELLRIGAIDILLTLLKDTLVLPLFREEYITLHEEYQQYVLPKIAESKKLAKSGKAKQKDTDLEYNLAKQVEKRILEAHEFAISQSDFIHRGHRTILKHELGRMNLFFTDQPSLLAPNIQMAIAALAVAQAEVIWYFSHVGLVLTRGKNRVMPVVLDTSDSTIGFLITNMERLLSLIRKYNSAIKAFAIGYLTGSAQRLRSLYESPGMVALDLQSDLRNSFLSIIDYLHILPKLYSDRASSSVGSDTLDLSNFRQDWLRIIMTVSSSRSPVNYRHLEKATVSTGKDSIISEGNMAFLWSRCVDDVDKLLADHSSLKVLCFYRAHVNLVFRHTMYGSDGRPHHCCSWLNIATTFPETAHYSVPDEPEKLAQDAVSYCETIIESLMEGMEGLINILDSDDGGFGWLDQQLLPQQAAIRLNQVAKSGILSTKSIKFSVDVALPGYESKPPSTESSVNTMEAAMQRLTNLCSELNDMEPVRVLNHVFVPREYMRDRILRNFRTRISNVILVDGDLQRPTVIEARIQRHMMILHLIEQHTGMDLTQGIREVIISEAFSEPLGRLSSNNSKSKIKSSAAAVTTICDWYIDKIVKDSNNTGVSFTPSEKCFTSVRPLGKIPTEMVADVSELKAFVRIFGSYGVDKFDTNLREQLVVLLNCIDITLRSNKEALEGLATGNMLLRSERDGAMKNISELETLMNFSLQVGHILSLRSLLGEAAAEILSESVPLIFSLVSDFVNHAPFSVPEKPAVAKIRMMASQIGAINGQDFEVVHSILLELGGAGDSTWALVPYLYVACMTSEVWNGSAFDVHTGGFGNNVHCLARCINAVIVASELVRFERKELQRQSISSRKCEDGTVVASDVTLEAVENNIRTMMRIFVRGAAAIALESWNDGNRHPLVAKLIFLDQVCDMSKYMARSTFEAHIPRSMLRSIYQLHYESSFANSIFSKRRQHSYRNIPSASAAEDASDNKRFSGPLRVSFADSLPKSDAV